MIDSAEVMSPVGGERCSIDPCSKNRENEKKKRSRVKQLLSDIKKQVEFWFGDVNLHKDRFLKQLIEDSRDGYVDLSVLTTFNRMKKMSTDCKLIARALKNSSLVEVNLEGTKVRRQNPLGDDPKDVDTRTVYVELLPKDVKHGWIERVFSKCGNVVYVSIPKYKTSGQSKGFAFVEFETEEQAQKAIEMLNNPPEDAPRKPGIFPKTKNGKQIPLEHTENVTQGEAEQTNKLSVLSAKVEAKTSVKVNEQEMVTSGKMTEMINDEEMASRQRLPAPMMEKKRRRSQSSGSLSQVQDDLPSKIRRTMKEEESQWEREKCDEKGSLSQVQDNLPSKIRRTMKEEESQWEREKCDEKDMVVKSDKEEDKMEDSLLKTKRKRKKKNKERLKMGDEVLPLRVISKHDWLALKQEYLTLQKQSMSTLKKCMTEIHQRGGRQQMEANSILQKEQTFEESEKAVKDKPKGPLFESGVIVKITHTMPLPGRKCIKEVLSEVSPVVYVDIVEGDAEGHVRFKSPEDAKAIINANEELQRKHNWHLAILSGDHEQRYWQKILVDRQVKLNRPREKKRGTEKLISKAEKIIIARAKEASKHIRFLED
ncbi:la-related protein 7 isoform X2 [Hypomesus transpacificus]|uniref:la-related protein 7 isoform X2 n=1 Tax=Hypomesus transpacificus TaxID=137520 RepID=UPI001F07DCFC|nr:la-related protein 7 isoform X2 [Hypomesus transpacificus]